MPYLLCQAPFHEGRQKISTIDVTAFVADANTSIQKFIDAAVRVVLGLGEVTEGHDLSTRYAVVKFRDYLGVPFEEILSASIPAKSRKHVDDFKHALSSASPCVFQPLLKYHLGVLHTKGMALTFQEQWQDAYELMKLYMQKDHLRGGYFAVELCRRYAMCSRK